MFLTRKNLKGGRRLVDFPICEDEKTLQFGFKIGYCEGCNEPLLVRISDSLEIANHLGASYQGYRKIFSKITPRIPLSVRFGAWLIRHFERDYGLSDSNLGYRKGD